MFSRFKFYILSIVQLFLQLLYTMQQDQHIHEQSIQSCLMQSNSSLRDCFDQQSPNIIHKISPTTNLDQLPLDHDSVQQNHEIFDINAHFVLSNNWFLFKQQRTYEKTNNLFHPYQHQNHQKVDVLIQTTKNHVKRATQYNIVDEVLQGQVINKCKQLQVKNLAALIKDSFKKQTRKDKVQRYLQKKEKRVWIKKISYLCRKKVADKRVRVNGRFVKKTFNNTCSTPKIKAQTSESIDEVKIEDDSYSNNANFYKSSQKN